MLDQLDGKTSDILLFEDKLGRAEAVSCDLLTEIISKSYSGKNKLEFVFVASCHSEVVGEVFLEAGASHVLCVKREERIRDQICTDFTELFYSLLLNGKNYTICEAFEMTKKQIESK